jgi:thymidylate synthase
MTSYTTTHAAYLGTLQDLLNDPSFKSAPRGLPILEKLDYKFTVMFPTSESIRTKDADRNQVIADYTAKEVELYNSCSRDVKDFAAASKFWNQLANPDGTVNSAYGYLIWKNKSCGSHFEGDKYPIEEVRNNPAVMNDIFRTPWEWAKQSLIQDKDTRQAVMRFSLPEHQWMGNKDQTCTMHANWLIRNNQLHLTVVMRSNDVVKGLVYDMPWFCSLMDRMVEELKPTYPDLEKGYYTHIAHSMHMYERDTEVVKKMLGQA